ncbi:hypothetical protein GWK47_001210 [Chionoecetes opilio]|uniref:Uncharacterized protein n=1 Tax=Chionoecetes opilio TaxID=41210 RepID=A0A8J5C2Z0_CHIOP|nr:hypothetical protein GWK47_001210 [Chionoecetes opilio]
MEQNGRYLMPGDNSVKLTHSRSSDSILTGVEVEVPPPKPPLPIGPDVAPPLPPKRKHLKGASQDTFAAHLHSLASPATHASPHNTSDWLHGTNSLSTTLERHGTNSLSGTLERGSLTNSSDQVSPASSLDSMHQTHDDPPASRTSIDSSSSLHERQELGADLGYMKHMNKSIDTLTISIGEANSSQNFYSSSSSRWVGGLLLCMLLL